MAISFTSHMAAPIVALSAFNLNFGRGRTAAADDSSTQAADGSQIFSWPVDATNDYEVYCVNSYIPTNLPADEADFLNGAGSEPYFSAGGSHPNSPFQFLNQEATDANNPALSGGGNNLIYALEDVILVHAEVSEACSVTWEVSLEEGALTETLAADPTANPVTDGVYSAVPTNPQILEVLTAHDSAGSVDVTGDSRLGASFATPTEPELRFVPLSGGKYTIRCTVTADSDASTATEEVDLYVLWRNPQAKTSLPPMVQINTPFELDASGSENFCSDARQTFGYDALADDDLTFSWQVSTAPAGSTATLQDSIVNGITETDKKIFTPDVLGTYTFGVSAYDANTSQYTWARDIVDLEFRQVVSTECFAEVPDFWPGNQTFPATDLNAATIASFGGRGSYRSSDLISSGNKSYDHWDKVPPETNQSTAGIIEGVWRIYSRQGNTYTTATFDGSNSWASNNAEIRYDYDARCCWAYPNGDGCVLGWQAPYSGTVTALASFSDGSGQHPVYGDGVDCRLEHTNADRSSILGTSKNVTVLRSGALLSRTETVAAGDWIMTEIHPRSNTSYDQTSFEVEIAYVKSAANDEIELPAAALQKVNIGKELERAHFTRFLPNRPQGDARGTGLSASEVIGGHVRPRAVLTSVNHTSSLSTSTGNGGFSCQLWGTNAAGAKSVPGYWVRLYGGPSPNAIDVGSRTTGEYRGWKYVPGTSTSYGGLYSDNGTSDWILQIREYLEVIDQDNPLYDATGVSLGDDVQGRNTIRGVNSWNIQTGIRVGTGGMYYCWVAREVFGATNPKWLKFRRWLLNKAPEKLREYYVEHGIEIANYLKANPDEKARLRLAMEQVI